MTRLRSHAQPPLRPLVFQPRRPIQWRLVWWLRFLGLAAFVALVVRLPRSEGVQLIRLDLRWLGACLLVVVCQLLLEAGVWQWLLRLQRIRHPYPKTLVAYLASRYLGLVTPWHAGEFLGAGYISMNTGLTMGYALSSVAMRKLLNLVAVIGFGIWALPLVGEVAFLHGVQQIVWTGVIVVASFALGIALWVWSLQRMAKKWQKLSPWKIELTEFWSGMRHLFSMRLLLPLALAALAFSLLFVEMDAVLRGLGVNASGLPVGQIMSLSQFAARLVPVSLAGFGLKDAAAVALLVQHGVEVSTAIAVAVFFLVCSYLPTLLLSGLCWWIKPLIVRRASPR